MLRAYYCSKLSGHEKILFFHFLRDLYTIIYKAKKFDYYNSDTSYGSNDLIDASENFADELNNRE